MIDFNKISSGLTQDGSIWTSGNISPVSYLDDGNDIFYQIEDDSFWFNHRNRVIHILVEKYNDSEFLLDVGGGNGVVSKYLQDNGINSILVEPGIDGVRNGEKRGIKGLINAKLEDVKFIDSSVPSIGAFDVIEHIENDYDFLQEIRRVLKNDGKLFLTIPAYRFLWSYEDIIAGHFRRFTKKTISKKLKEAGFGIEYSSYLFSILVLPIFLFRSIPSLFSKSEKEKPETKAHKSKTSFLARTLSSLLRLELKIIAKNKTIKFGSSIIIVARKLKQD